MNNNFLYLGQFLTVFNFGKISSNVGKSAHSAIQPIVQRWKKRAQSITAECTQRSLVPHILSRVPHGLSTTVSLFITR